MERVRGAVDDDVVPAEREFAHLEGRDVVRVADENDARFVGSGRDKIGFFRGDAHSRGAVEGAFGEDNAAAQRRAVDFDGGDAIFFGVNEKDAYYLGAIGGDLFHRDMEAGIETMLLQKVQSYSLTDNRLYVTQNVDEKYVLKTRLLGEDDFKEIPLTFEPIQVLAADNTLFLQMKKPYQIVRYCDGEETPLPIHSIKYQYLDGKIIYSDDKTFKNSSWTVKSYDLDTGAEQVLCEGVFEFGVFEEGFAVFWCRTETGSAWKLFDFETNELKQIYPSA